MTFIECTLHQQYNMYINYKFVFILKQSEIYKL